MDSAHSVSISTAYGLHWSQVPILPAQSLCITNEQPVITKDYNVKDLHQLHNRAAKTWMDESAAKYKCGFFN